MALVVGRHPERHQHPVQELAPVALRVGDEPDGQVLGQAPEQVAQERGLAGADLAGDHRDRRVRQHAVFQHGVGPRVVLRPVEEVRVGQEREGSLGQPEMVVVDPQRTRHTHPAPTHPPSSGTNTAHPRLNSSKSSTPDQPHTGFRAAYHPPIWGWFTQIASPCAPSRQPRARARRGRGGASRHAPGSIPPESPRAGPGLAACPPRRFSAGSATAGCGILVNDVIKRT